MASFEIGHDSQSGPDSAVSSPTMGTTPVTPIAVIGMACRLPGGIDSPEQLWEALLRGDDLVTEFPPDRWDVDEYYDPEPGVPGRSVSKWGGLLDDVAGFDSEFFGISESEAVREHRHQFQSGVRADRLRPGGPRSCGHGGHGMFVWPVRCPYGLSQPDRR